jgi:hypothetical protein
MRSITGIIVAGNHWLALQLVGAKSNRSAIGARIAVRSGSLKQVNRVTTSTGYACSSEPVVHFGLGRNSGVDSIEIEWPSGTRQTLTNIAADSLLTVHELVRQIDLLLRLPLGFEPELSISFLIRSAAPSTGAASGSGSLRASGVMMVMPRGDRFGGRRDNHRASGGKSRHIGCEVDAALASLASARSPHAPQVPVAAQRPTGCPTPIRLSPRNRPKAEWITRKPTTSLSRSPRARDCRFRTAWMRKTKRPTIVSRNWRARRLTARISPIWFATVGRTSLSSIARPIADRTPISSPTLKHHLEMAESANARKSSRAQRPDAALAIAAAGS